MVRLFGTTLNETLSAFRTELGENDKTAEDRSKAIFRIIFSLIAVIVGVYFVLHEVGDSQQIGSTILGVVFGYWIK